MAESESYEDADSNIYDHQKFTDIQKYQNFQGGGNFAKKRNSKENESSSIYQDARSRVTNNSNNSPDKNVNNISPYEKNEGQLKLDYLTQNKMYNDENNFRENENYYKENNFNDDNNNNDDEGQSEYSEPEGGITPKNLTLFEGASQRGGCCNLPKCLIF